jgi:Tfp pilus assembly protein PilV
VVGFSMMEVMLSSSMMLVGIAGMFSAYSTLSDHYAHQRYMTEGLHIAEAELEGMLIRFRDDPLLSAGVHPEVSGYNKMGVRTLGTPFFTVDVRVSAHPVVAGYRRVTVIVRWPERGRIASVQLSSVRS